MLNDKSGEMAKESTELEKPTPVAGVNVNTVNLEKFDGICTPG